MRPPLNRKRFDYDIFISYSRADQEWVRILTVRLTEQEYNGRRLRPWLDEHFLDPGNLGSTAELTTAMDRSRFFALVMSPEAMTSEWVDFEVRHFLDSRGREAILRLLRRDCSAPAGLLDLLQLDFRSEGLGAAPLNDLIARLCPAGEVSVADVERSIDTVFQAVEDTDPGGFSATPSPERDALFEALTFYDIDDAAAEGFAVAAFSRAATRLLQLGASESYALYNCKMLLGECLTGALYRSVAYRQLAQHFLDLAELQSNGHLLLFVVARAYSKLAEIDPLLVDMSVLLRVCAQLDAKPRLINEEQAIQMLIGRIVGKLRDHPAGEMMIKTLSERGRSSRIAAAGGISLSAKRSSPVFYLSELESLHATRPTEQGTESRPPSKRLLGELMTLDLEQDKSVQSVVRLAKEELSDEFPGIEFPYPFLWGIRRGIEVTNAHNAPFMGTIVKATLSNMAELADTFDVSSVACLTEPRIVEALFDNCGALLILKQDPDSAQCRRLRDRGVPFAMLSQEVISELRDGDHIVVDQHQISVMKGNG